MANCRNVTCIIYLLHLFTVINNAEFILSSYFNRFFELRVWTQQCSVRLRKTRGNYCLADDLFTSKKDFAPWKRVVNMNKRRVDLLSELNVLIYKKRLLVYIRVASRK